MQDLLNLPYTFGSTQDQSCLNKVRYLGRAPWYTSLELKGRRQWVWFPQIVSPTGKSLVGLLSGLRKCELKSPGVFFWLEGGARYYLPLVCEVTYSLLKVLPCVRIVGRSCGFGNAVAGKDELEGLDVFLLFRYESNSAGDLITLSIHAITTTIDQNAKCRYGHAGYLLDRGSAAQGSV